MNDWRDTRSQSQGRMTLLVSCPVVFAHCRGQLGAGRDLKLWKDAVQMEGDGFRRQEHPIPDLAIRQATRGKLGDLSLLRCELVDGPGWPSLGADAGGSKFDP